MAATPTGSRRVRAPPQRVRAPMSEINVTPFVDVMLVLLIVFMVSAPLLTSGVPLDLPQAAGQAAHRRQTADHRHLKQDGKIFVGENEIDDRPARADAHAMAEDGLDERIYVRGDRAATTARS